MADSMPFKCEPCNREFNDQEALAQHNRDKHGVGKESKAEDKEKEQLAKKEQKESELEKSLKAKKIKRAAKYGIALLIILGLLYLVITSLSSSPASKARIGLGPAGSQHVHADFKVYLDNRVVDFSQPRYQVRAQHVHIEGGDGDVIHIHATGVKTGYFFSTLGMKFNSTCFVTERAYCSNDNKTLKFFVNGVPAGEWEDYILQSMDKILISYGNETNLESQFNSIASKAEALDTGRAPLPRHNF